MPAISAECNVKKIVLDGYIPGIDNLSEFLLNVASRAKVLEAYSKMINIGNNSSTKMFKIINYLKRELNNRFEEEKKEGKEINNNDMDMINILEDKVPDLIIKECRTQRNINNMKMGGRKSRKNRKSKNRKSRRN